MPVLSFFHGKALSILLTEIVWCQIPSLGIEEKKKDDPKSFNLLDCFGGLCCSQEQVAPSVLQKGSAATR